MFCKTPETSAFRNFQHPVMSRSKFRGDFYKMEQVSQAVYIQYLESPKTTVTKRLRGNLSCGPSNYDDFLTISCNNYAILRPYSLLTPAACQNAAASFFNAGAI